MRIFFAVLAVYTVIFSALLTAACKEKYKPYYIVFKSINSASFVVIFMMATFQEQEQFWLMLPAFLCCFAGDVLLGFYNRYQSKWQFLAGLSVFLCGHIFFVRWMCRQQRLTPVDILFPIAAVGIVYVLTAVKGMNTGRLRPCILVYTFFVALLFAKSVNIAAADSSLQNLTASGGALLFLISDITILFLYFYHKSGIRIHILNLVTYFYGIFFLAVCRLF